MKPRKKANKVVVLKKESGETPLACLERYRAAHPEFAKEKMTYAGRLDPLAEGVLIALIGEACKDRAKYTSLDKKYEVDILFGFETDTYDILGKIIDASQSVSFPEAKLRPALQSFVGNFLQEYPPYSSKTVAGKHLFQYAREGKLGEIEIPKRKVKIYKVDFIEHYELSGAELLVRIVDKISAVKGDFRQKEILTLWKAALEPHEEEKFRFIKIKVACGSGTYMRSLAHSLGKKLSLPALAYHIKRTKVGNR